MRKNRPPHRKFPGFPHEWDDEYGFTQYPNMLTEFWADLSGSAQKVLDFIIRQTIGWDKEEDTIALSQFRNGIVGKLNNRGTGLSNSQIRRAIKELEDGGYITVERNRNRPSTFRLVFDDEYTEEEMIEIRKKETEEEGEEEEEDGDGEESLF
jgi:phage replication O-like protein O